MPHMSIYRHDDLFLLIMHVFGIAANPQMNSLYGGRMTQARLREVGSVTAEAIERLHKYTNLLIFISKKYIL